MSSRKATRQCQGPDCISPPDPSTTTTSTTSYGSSAPSSSTDSGSTPVPTATSAPPFVVVAPSLTTLAASSSTAVASASSTSSAGMIAGCVIGGVVFVALVILGILLYLRARKRRRTPPSSEFMNSIRAGTAPVLRLDSGAEYSPALPEKGGGHAHYPPSVPLPFMQNSYYTSPPMSDMKFPDEMMMSDIPSTRPSVEKPLHPQRFSSPQPISESHGRQHYPSSSVGSRRELWGSDTEVALGELTPARQSPARADSALQFVSRFSLDDPLYPSHSPLPLHPLRRKPDLEET